MDAVRSVPAWSEVKVKIILSRLRGIYGYGASAHMKRLKFLQDKGQSINDSLLFDQFIQFDLIHIFEAVFTKEEDN